MKFEGIYTPIVTPYDDNHGINYDAVEAIVDDLISSGVHGLIVAGTTGEYYSQEKDERLQLMKTCKEVIDNRLPFVAVSYTHLTLPTNREV